MHGPMQLDPSGGVVDGEDFSRQSLIKLYFTGTGTISSGVIIAEEAPEKDTPGTWVPITGVSLTASDVSAGGAVKAFQFPVGAYAFVRLRATTPVAGGGTVTCIAESMPPVW